MKQVINKKFNMSKNEASNEAKKLLNMSKNEASNEAKKLLNMSKNEASNEAIDFTDYNFLINEFKKTCDFYIPQCILRNMVDFIILMILLVKQFLGVLNI